MRNTFFGCYIYDGIQWFKVVGEMIDGSDRDIEAVRKSESQVPRKVRSECHRQFRGHAVIIDPEELEDD